MESQHRLPMEVQPSIAQTSASTSTPPVVQPVMGPSTTVEGVSPAVGTPLKNSSSSTNESVQEPAHKKHAGAHGALQPSFSYMNANASLESSQQSLMNPAVTSGSPIGASSLQPPVPGQLTGRPSFSYNISHGNVGSQQLPSNTPSSPGYQLQGKTASHPDQSLQHPLPFPSAQPNAFISGASLQMRTPSGPLPASVPQNVSSTGANHSFYGNSQANQIDQSKSVSQAMPRTPMAPNTPGSSPAMFVPSNMPAPSPPADSVMRPVIPPANPLVQPQAYGSYPSIPSIAVGQGPWLQPQPVTGIVRSPYSPYPAAYSSPPAVAPRGVSISWSDTHPPGVTPIGAPTPSTGPGGQASADSRMPSDLPPGMDIDKHTNHVDKKEGSLISEQGEAWTAHRTESGAIYYYNALTGESTYEKPSGFKGEPDNVTAQPTPISWEKLAGTDWTLVTTNDGKRYYYNTKTKLSSWQIPKEVLELKKQQDSDGLSSKSMSVGTSSLLTEKASTPVSLNAPAINTGGRDAIALRPSAVAGLSSALDLIKKKLQDSGSPATTSPGPASSGAVAPEVNGSKTVDATIKGLQGESTRDKAKDANTDGNASESSSDSEDEEKGPTTEECIVQFKEMLKERGVAPFSKWEKELPKILFDPRFKAVPSHSGRRAIFEHYVKTRADEERKEKRAALKAALEGFKQLLDEVKEEIDHHTDYQTFKKKWGNDPRFQALDRKEKENLLNERVLPLKRAAQEKVRKEQAAAVSSFKSLLREHGDITSDSRWSKVKDSLRNDPRYKLVRHEEREAIFNEYISELKAGKVEKERISKAKHDEEEKLKERERALRKRKEREEQEVERVRLKALRKEAVESYQALLVETIKDPQASWTESKSKLEKDPQGRAGNPHLEQSDLEKLFREHVKILHERCAQEFKALLGKVVTVDAAGQETESGKTVLNSWSTAKRLLKDDPRYNKMPRKDRESLWRRHVEDILRKQKSTKGNQGADKHAEARSSVDSGRLLSRSRTGDRR